MSGVFATASWPVWYLSLLAVGAWNVAALLPRASLAHLCIKVPLLSWWSWRLTTQWTQAQSMASVVFGVCWQPPSSIGARVWTTTMDGAASGAWRMTMAAEEIWEVPPLPPTLSWSWWSYCGPVRSLDLPSSSWRGPVCCASMKRLRQWALIWHHILLQRLMHSPEEEEETLVLRSIRPLRHTKPLRPPSERAVAVSLNFGF